MSWDLQELWKKKPENCDKFLRYNKLCMIAAFPFTAVIFTCFVWWSTWHRLELSGKQKLNWSVLLERELRNVILGGLHSFSLYLPWAAHTLMSSQLKCHLCIGPCPITYTNDCSRLWKVIQFTHDSFIGFIRLCDVDDSSALPLDTQTHDTTATCLINS